MQGHNIEDVCRESASVDIMVPKILEMLKEMNKMVDAFPEVDTVCLIALLERFANWVEQKVATFKAPHFPGRYSPLHLYCDVISYRHQLDDCDTLTEQELLGFTDS